MEFKILLLNLVITFILIVPINCYTFYTFKPTFYNISLDFSHYTSKERIFNGLAKIDFNVTQGTYGMQTIEFDSELLQITKLGVYDLYSGKSINVIHTNSKGYKYTISINLEEAVGEVRVLIEYEGQVGKAGDTGVYTTDEGNIIGTNSYPLGVRRIFPCVNDPSIRTSFILNVKLVNDKWGIHHLTDAAESPFLPAHAVGFIMTLNYRLVDDISTDRFNVWVPSGNKDLYDSVNNNQILKKALAKNTYFDNFFEQADLDKIHIVMVPGLNQPSVVTHRLISLRPDFMIFSKKQTAEMTKGCAVAIINALSKHFFRCVISPNNWEEFWLADSIALYLQYALLNETIFDEPDYPELFITDLQRPAMRGSSIEVNPSTINPEILITSEVYPPAYQGAAILKMLETIATPNGMTDSIYNYFFKFVYKNVKTSQFLNFMSNQYAFRELKTYGKQLIPILDEWIHETGYPYITDVTLTSKGFSVTQETFIGSNKTKADWIIPFDYTDANLPSGSLQWISGRPTTQFNDPLIGSWVILNKGSKGMFRVNYGELTNNLIMDTVYKSLSASERAALVDDAYVLAWKEIKGTNLGYFLSLFDKVAMETDYIPFSIAMSHVTVLKHLYSQKGLADNFELKIAEVLFETYSGISWYKNDPILLGSALWTRAAIESSCDNYVSTCQTDAVNYANGESKILHDLLPTINCYLVRQSHEKDWINFFNKFYNKKDTQYARADALYALACPNKFQVNGSDAISQYFDKIYSGDILEEDAHRAFSYIYSRPEHLNQSFTYIHDEFSTLLSRFGDDFMASLISDISQLLLPYYYNDLMNDIKHQSLVKTKTHSVVVRAQDEMAKREQFVNANFNQVQNWVQSNSTTYSPLPPPTFTPPSPRSAASSHLSNIIFFSLQSIILVILLESIQ